MVGVVQPTIDVRALRVWENFEEGILLLYIARFEAAVPAEFSYISLPPLPGFLIHVEEVTNFSTITIDWRVGQTLTPVIGVGVAVARDSRIGLGANTPYSWNSGAEPALSGTVAGRQQASTTRRLDHIIHPGGENLALIGGTINTAVSVDVLLKLVPIR